MRESIYEKTVALRHEIHIHPELSMEEVETICEILPQVVEYLRSISPVWKDLESGKAKHILV